MTSDTTIDFARAVQRVRLGEDVAAVTEVLLEELTQDEKLFLLDGDAEFWAGMAEMGRGYNLEPIVMGQIDRLGIPGLRFSDGPRGVVMGASTAFPVSMARGATWDVALEERIGIAIGKEMRAQGGNFFGGVCINLLRHPAWGRAQETYGEDSHLLGEFGAALTRGVRRNGMAVAKHYALNSMEDARFTVNVVADDATLHEVYLPHFRRAVEAGVEGVMTSYNQVNGEWAGENRVLMEDILRGSWGFEGVTVSDFIWGLRDAAKSLRSGLDVEEPFRQQRAEHLPADLEAGRVSWADVDRSARRILATQIAFSSRDLDDAPGPEVVFAAEHRALARDAAAAGAVLLKNDRVEGAPVLPISRSVSSIAVIGRLADLPNTGDGGSSAVRSPAVATALTGLTEALPDALITYTPEDDPGKAADAAAAAHVAVLVVGYTAADEGEGMGSFSRTPEFASVFPVAPEGMDFASLMMSAGDEVITMGSEPGGDRRSLRLRPIDADIIRATAAANPRTVVVIVTAGAVITEEWRDVVPAVVVGWYSGSEGGRALADVLLGEHDATGRLPYAIPVREEDLPFFDPDTTEIVYDRWHGQRLLDKNGVRAAFPLGFGLSYTSFAIGEVEVGPVANEGFEATVAVTNTGERDGAHVVQLYARVEADDFPERVLVGFGTIQLAAGETRTARIHGSTRPIDRWTPEGFTPAAARVLIEASSFSGDPDASTASLDLLQR